MKRSIWREAAVQTGAYLVFLAVCGAIGIGTFLIWDRLLAPLFSGAWLYLAGVGFFVVVVYAWHVGCAYLGRKLP